MELTSDELTFIQRMLPHFMNGMSAEDAARAVLADDQRIASSVLDYSHSAVTSSARADVQRKISDAVYGALTA